MKRHAACLALSILCGAHEARAQHEPYASKPVKPNAGTAQETIVVDVRRIARIETDDGSFVEWLATDPASPVPSRGSIALGIGAEYPNPPLVAADFAEAHSPLEVFLAVADPEVPVPRALLSGADVETRVDRDERERLRRLNQEALGASDFDSLPALAFDGGNGCAPEFTRWVGAVYGDASCGSVGAPGQEVFSITQPFHTYCVGSSCDFELGKVDANQCVPALESCDVVRGTIRNVRGRVTNWHGRAEMVAYGFEQHFGAANCSGDGNITFARGRTRPTGGGSSAFGDSIDLVELTHLPVGHMVHYHRGTRVFPAQAELLVSFGLWTHGAAPGDPGHERNRAFITGNDGPSDRAILCGDVASEYTMNLTAPGSCHGPGVHLCSGPDCTSACFYCAGGAC